MFCIDENTEIGEAKEHFGVALGDLLNKQPESSEV